ncbi:MAG TPA: DUF1207 domain-containing protein [Ignavibacteriaceae bacterium]|nr:DUF1207 domain-containing protein [Ignavibacteriaceae bacterium]
MKKFFLILILFLLTNSYPQNKFEFFPSGLNFTPLKANNMDAKIGLNYFPENINMKIDIGNNIDLVEFKVSDRERLTAGIEFLAYALSRSYQDKRLQIDAVDGFFGGNISYSKKIEDNLLSGRLSIVHNSAHLVDGHWDFRNNRWIDNYKPVPYAKDFAELLAAYTFNINLTSLRTYTGIAYSFLIRPSDMKRLNIEAGFEVGVSSLFGRNVVPFIAHDFSLSGTAAYQGNNNSLVGIKLGEWEGKGILLFISYYNGYDVFHSYYKRKVERFGFGFTVDFL